MKSTGENVVRIEAEALRALADRIDGPDGCGFLSVALECWMPARGVWWLPAWARAG